MKSNKEPFAECPHCHEFSLRVATYQEKQKAEKYLIDDWSITDAPIASYHFIVCSRCGYFDVMSDYPWDKWFETNKEILNRKKK